MTPARTTRNRTRRVWHVAAVLLVLAALQVPAGAARRSRTVPKPAGDGRVLVLPLDGPISPVTAEALESALARAGRQGYRALVVEIDTPGGLESSMRVMVQHLFAAPVPVITWVTPGGARAASAGVFIVMAGDFAAMAPGTNIGAATPINMQGPMDSTLARKATNDAAAFARTVANQRGRNRDWAEQAVRQAVAVEEDEAVRLNVVDTTAATFDELLALADGHGWTRGAHHGRIEVRGLPGDRIATGFRQRLLALLAEPNVAYILMLLGFYGLIFELQNPGALLPGVVGGICLILAFLALSVLPVNYAGVALIALAMVFFIAEIKVASHGVLAAGGTLALVLGSLILFRGAGGAAHLSWSVIAGATLVTAAFFLFVVGAGLRAQRRPVATGAAGLVGRRGIALARLDPDGPVRIGDEIWRAVAGTPVDAGSAVEITGIQGLTLRVRPLAKEA